METNSLGGAGQFTAWQKLHKQGNPRSIFPLIRKKEIKAALLFNHTAPPDSPRHSTEESTAHHDTVLPDSPRHSAEKSTTHHDTASPHSPRHSAEESTTHHDTALPDFARHKERKRKKEDIFFSPTEEHSLIPSGPFPPLLKGARRKKAQGPKKHKVQKITRPKISKGRSQQGKEKRGYLSRQALALFQLVNPGDYPDNVPKTDPQKPGNRITLNTFIIRVVRNGWLTEEQKIEIEPIKDEARKEFQKLNPSITNDNSKKHGIDPENPNGERITRRSYMIRKINEYWNQKLPNHTSPTAPDVADH